LDRGGRPLLFLPSHQSILDHPVMNSVLQRPELLAALGWPESTPCVILARAGLWKPAEVRLGPWRLSLIGASADEADRFLTEVDGHVLLQRSRDTGNPTQLFARKLQERPGVVYGAGTTAAHPLQCLPMQHGLFAQLPADVVVIPMVFRGIHALWPKCPRGNLRINPGRVEVVVCPPMLGETTLLPRKRALRTQLEPATLFQAVHLATLYNPEAAVATAPAVGP
jgi:1-acyl-sn-glycerol-3-phosphate acyltransferase